MLIKNVDLFTATLLLHVLHYNWRIRLLLKFYCLRFYAISLAAQIHNLKSCFRMRQYVVGNQLEEKLLHEK